MPYVTDAPHEAFPEDDRLYRIHWTGEQLMPQAGDSTHRIRSWLQELDSSGTAVRGLRQVTESVGAIPKLVIGSCWRNGRVVSPGRDYRWSYKTLTLLAPGTWKVVKAGDFVSPDFGPKSRRWIEPADMQLDFTTDTNRGVDGRNALVIPAKTARGQKVVLPCFEVFRAFYGGTTDLAHALLSETWDRAEPRFIVGSEETEGADGFRWQLDLAPGVPSAAVPYLCWLRFSKEARAAANATCRGAVNEGIGPVWITALPPVTNCILKIAATTYQLSNDWLLVTQIHKIAFPIKVAELSYSVVLNVPVKDSSPSVEAGSPAESAPASTTQLSVSKPRDARPQKRYFQLPSTGVMFDGLPRAIRRVRSERNMPIRGRTPTTGQPIRRRVSVGVPTTRGGPPRAQFTPEEENLLVDRFGALYRLLDDMLRQKLIAAAEPYPIVRPVPGDSPAYCEFPKITADGRTCRWSFVWGPNRRLRLALVVQIQIGDRFIYIIETEITNRHKGHYALAVETISNEPLDESVLDALLDVCASRKGVWPERLPFGEGTIISERIRHAKIAEVRAYSQTAVLKAFANLQLAKDGAPVPGSEGVADMTC